MAKSSRNQFGATLPNGAFTLNSNPGQLFLFAGVRDGRLGVQCERSLRALSYVFHEWSLYAGDRKSHEMEKVPANCLPIIHFEKLATLLRRLWNSQWNLSENQEIVKQCANNTASSDLHEAVITHPSPFMEKRAKHGKRLLRMDGEQKTPTYLAEIIHELHKLRDQQVVSYFSVEVKPMEGDTQDVSRRKGNPHTSPSDHRTIVGPTLPFIDPNLFLEGFTKAERDFLFAVGQALKRLSSCELRALGTHSDVTETMADIRLEVQKMQQHAKLARQALLSGECFYESGDETCEYADEAWRKSTRNEEPYRSGHAMALTEIPTGGRLRMAFQECQMPPQQIWKSSQIQPLKVQAERALPISQYASAVAFFRRSPEQISLKSDRARMYEHRFTEGAKGLRYLGIGDPPNTLKESFEKPGVVATGVRAQLAELLQSI